MAFPDYNDNAARSYAVELSELEARDDAISSAAAPIAAKKLADDEWLGEALIYGTPGYELEMQVVRELAQGRLSETTAKRMHLYLHDTAQAEAEDEERWVGRFVDDLNF